MVLHLWWNLKASSWSALKKCWSIGHAINKAPNFLYLFIELIMTNINMFFQIAPSHFQYCYSIIRNNGGANRHSSLWGLASSVFLVTRIAIHCTNTTFLVFYFSYSKVQGKCRWSTHPSWCYWRTHYL